MLNKQKGNMYPFVTHTWNPIKGKCPHDCTYCYMKRWKLPKLHLDEKEFKTDLGKGNFIFVGSSCDMFANVVPAEWIQKTISLCKKYPKNTYLFQTKNPKRFRKFDWFGIRHKVVFGTTIETNRIYKDLTTAPHPSIRSHALANFKVNGFARKMISIEPIMDFDPDILISWIKAIKPEFVSIGADSKGHGLPEPTWDKITDFICEIAKFTNIYEKDNLGRLKRKGK